MKRRALRILVGLLLGCFSVLGGCGDDVEFRGSFDAEEGGSFGVSVEEEREAA